MFLSDLTAECVESIRAHHASGHFDHDDARARLMGTAGESAGRADAMLAAPVGRELYDEFGTWPPDGAARVPCETCERALLLVCEEGR